MDLSVSAGAPANAGVDSATCEVTSEPYIVGMRDEFSQRFS
jgi:hypothetical protein